MSQINACSMHFQCIFTDRKISALWFFENALNNDPWHGWGGALVRLAPVSKAKCCMQRNDGNPNWHDPPTSQIQPDWISKEHLATDISKISFCISRLFFGSTCFFWAVSTVSTTCTSLRPVGSFKRWRMLVALLQAPLQPLLLHDKCRRCSRWGRSPQGPSVPKNPSTWSKWFWPELCLPRCSFAAKTRAKKNLHPSVANRQLLGHCLQAMAQKCPRPHPQTGWFHCFHGIS